MAGTVGNSPAPVMERLLEEPWKFEFFAAVQWLERLHRSQSGDAAPVGASPNPQREFIRFVAQQQQSFAASDLAQIEREPTAEFQTRWQLFVNMMGLTGPNGVLPSPYLQTALEQDRAARSTSDATEEDQASALPDFYNLFDHRAISLFYRAWSKYRLPAIYAGFFDSPERHADDPVTNVLYSVTGLATGPHSGRQALRHKHRFPDEIVLYYAGAFSKWPRTAITLRNVVAEYFQFPVEVQEFQPQTIELAPQEQSRTASKAQPEGQNAALGQTVMIGSRICLYGARFRLRVGPLSRKDFDSLLPESERFKKLVEFVKLYAGIDWDFDIQLVLRADEVPASRLAGKDAPPAQLMRNSWMLSKPATEDRDDVVLQSRNAFVTSA